MCGEWGAAGIPHPVCASIQPRTPVESLINANLFVKTIEDRQGLKIGCIEEIAYTLGYIDDSGLKQLAKPFNNNGYGEYLLEILQRGRRKDGVWKGKYRQCTGN